MRRTQWVLAAFLVIVGGSRIASANPPASRSAAALRCPKLTPLWRGVLCIVAGRYERIITICDELVSGDADNRYAFALRGYAHLSRENEARQAIADLSEVIRRAPHNAVILVARARAYRQARDYDRAIADCTEAIRIDPKYGEAYARRAGCYLQKRVTDKAIADYSTALRHSPYLTWARCGRGEAYRRRGESARALADLEEVLRTDPDDEEAHLNRCNVYLYNLHDCDRVIAESSEFIRLYPREPQWYTLRCMAYLAKGEMAKGLHDGATAGSLKPGLLHLHCSLNPHSLFLGFSFGPGGDRPAPSEEDSEDRIADCTKRLASDPKNVAAYYERAWRYGGKGEFKRALADFDQIIRLDPADAEAYRQRGRVHHGLKAYSDAMDDYKNALRLDPANADYYVGRAALYTVQEQYEEALRDYDAALRIDPRIAVAHAYRGWMYGHHREYEPALAEYTEAVRLDPDDVTTYAGRAWVRARQGNYEGAIADYKKILQLDPHKTEAHDALAWHLATCPEARLRNGKEARNHATIACEASSWRKPSYLSTFAAACAECGDFKEAEKWQTKARELAPDKEKHYKEKCLKLYREHKPYHATPPRGVSTSSLSR